MKFPSLPVENCDVLVFGFFLVNQFVGSNRQSNMRSFGGADFGEPTLLVGVHIRWILIVEINCVKPKANSDTVVETLAVISDAA